MFDVSFCSSLVKIFPESNITVNEVNKFTALKNEPFSFQVLYKLADSKSRSVPFYFKLETDIPVNVYSSEYVKVLGDNNVNFPEKYNSFLFADMLVPKKYNCTIVDKGGPFGHLFFEEGETNFLKASSKSTKSLWIAVNENGEDIPAGEHKLKFTFYKRNNNEFICEASTSIQIIDAKLPEQELIYTNWFHCDCLSDFYNVEIFSDRFFEIFEDYVRTAAKNGMNMILMPAFTPPLDTHVGYERKTAQLVGVRLEKGKYTFDFSLLKKYIDISKKCGINYFEHSHLFTQWGANACPKIMAWENNESKRIFGWDTPADDGRYAEFLAQYLPELKKFLISEDLFGKVLFHISDEPESCHEELYARAKAMVSDMLEGYMLGDALSNYSLFENKIVEMPIASIRVIDEFIGKCDSLWCYYTGGHQGDFSNRTLLNSSERNRMIGIQMYYNNVKGFLHWAYNYYYDIMSNGLYDPKLNPEGFGNVPGSAYFVYPAHNGTAFQSIRQKVFYEAINDMRALKLFEELFGREKADKLIEKHFGKVMFRTEAKSPEKIIDFRNELNNIINQKING